MTAMARAIDALLDMCTNAEEFSTLQIIDGDPAVVVEGDVLVIGFSPDRLAVEGTKAEAGLRAESETFDIVCLASAGTGGPVPFKPLRDRADQIYQVVRGLVRADRRLQNTVTKANVRTTAYEQIHIRNDKGHVATSAATFEFVVTCTAIT